MLERLHSLVEKVILGVSFLMSDLSGLSGLSDLSGLSGLSDLSGLSGLSGSSIVQSCVPIT